MTDETHDETEKAADVTNLADSPNLRRIFGEAMFGSPERLIEHEQQGQRELVNSTQLPRQGLMNAREMWERIGIKINDADPGSDPLFVQVTLPEGWSKRAADHHMWSDLVDDKGRVRARIFYKAAFYDRRANIDPTCRFSVKRYDDGPREEWETTVRVDVRDGSKVIHSISAPLLPGQDLDREVLIQNLGAEDRLVAECRRWLVEHGLPNYKDPLAHWDDEPTS